MGTPKLACPKSVYQCRKEPVSTPGGYLPLIQKDSSTHMHGLTVYVKEGLPFAQELSLKNLQILTYVFDWLYFTVSYFFSLYWSPSSSLCTVFDSISSNIDEVLSINPSTNVFVFGHFNAHHKNQLILVKMIGLVNSAIIFLSQMTLLRWSTFLLRFQTRILIVLLFWMFFFLLMVVFVYK